MTTDYIAFHAAERPSAVAIVVNGREISYAAFARDLRKMTRALREFALPRGAYVAIGVNDIYSRWLLRLAFERLCVVTFAGLHRLRPLQLPRGFDLVVAEKKFLGESDRRQHALTPEWLQAVLARDDGGDESIPAKKPDDPLRILLTSGTTGTSKKLLYSRRVHEGSVTKMMWFANLTRHSRYLDNTDSVAAFTACVRAGGTVVFEDRVTPGEAIMSYAITHVALVPVILRQILDELPSNFARPHELKIFSSG